MDTIKHNTDDYAMCEYVLSSFSRSEFIIKERSDYIAKTKRNAEALKSKITEKKLDIAQRELDKAIKRQQAVLDTLQELTDTENIVYYAYYVHKMTTNEVAYLLNISRRQVIRIKHGMLLMVVALVIARLSLLSALCHQLTMLTTKKPRTMLQGWRLGCYIRKG